MKKYDDALAELARLIDAGWEFPDASARVAVQYGVKIGRLTALYDAMCGGN